MITNISNIFAKKYIYLYKKLFRNFMHVLQKMQKGHTRCMPFDCINLSKIKREFHLQAFQALQYLPLLKQLSDLPYQEQS